MVDTANVDKASSFSIVGGVSIFESKKYVAGVYNVGHIFADLEGVFDDLVHFLFCFASFFVHLVEKEGGCFLYKVGGGWCVYARSYAKGFDFFWEDGYDLDVVCAHGVFLSVCFVGWVVVFMYLLAAVLGYMVLGSGVLVVLFNWWLRLGMSDFGVDLSVHYV